MKYLTRILAGSLLALGGAFPALAAPEPRPNVLIIVTDDQGPVDAGCYGAKDLVTPSIDSLARQGVRFTQFESASSTGSPCRPALLTGCLPARRGPPGGEPTMAESFKAAGYATAYVGEWDPGDSSPSSPSARGFDLSFGRADDDRGVDQAGKFMHSIRPGPFLLYVAIDRPQIHPDSQGPDRFKPHRDARTVYAAAVATMDARIGRLLDTLEDPVLREHTLVVFQSDHGHLPGDQASLDGGAGPYRGASGSLFEGGIRVPAIISWPGHIPAGAVRKQWAHECDWLPTLAELCNVAPLSWDIDGCSLAGVLESADAETPHSILHWQSGSGPNAQWAVREADWKLIANAPDSADGHRPPSAFPIWLSNLSIDASEGANLAAQYPSAVARLQKLRKEFVTGTH